MQEPGEVVGASQPVTMILGEGCGTETQIRPMAHGRFFDEEERRRFQELQERNDCTKGVCDMFLSFEEFPDVEHSKTPFFEQKK